jgi:iron complex transport system permease protein
VLRPARLVAVLAALALLLLAAIAVGLGWGPSSVSLREALGVLLDAGSTGPAADIVRRIRLPRVAAGALVGASLSVAGVVFQALLRNPLADPFVLASRAARRWVASRY